MPFIYSNGKYNKAGNLIYNDNGTNKRVMYAYIGDGTEYGQEVYRGGNEVTYVIDTESFLEPTIETMFRWTGDNVLEDLDFIPHKDGYTFMGWSASPEPCTPSGGGLYTWLTMIGDPITLYANFKKTVTLTVYDYSPSNPSHHTDYTDLIIYNNGDETLPTFTVTPTVKPDYSFIGWTLNNESGYATIDYDDITDRQFGYDTTVYAIYHYKDNMRYGYAVNGSIAMLENPIAVNAINTQLLWYPHLTLADPTKDQATFMGWSTDGTRNITYYPFSTPGQQHVDNIPIMNYGIVFSAVFKYADSPLDPSETRKILINSSYPQSGLIDGSDVGSWLRLYDDSGNELSYDCSMFERVDATGICSLDQEVGLYIRDTYGSNQSYGGTDENQQPKNGMLNGTFNNVSMDLPTLGVTTLCVGVMGNSTAYVSNVNVNGGVRLIGRTTVG